MHLILLSIAIPNLQISSAQVTFLHTFLFSFSAKFEWYEVVKKNNNTISVALKNNPFSSTAWVEMCVLPEICHLTSAVIQIRTPQISLTIPSEKKSKEICYVTHFNIYMQPLNTIPISTGLNNLTRFCHQIHNFHIVFLIDSLCR